MSKNTKHICIDKNKEICHNNKLGPVFGDGKGPIGYSGDL